MWTFSQTNGGLYTPDSKLLSLGYSGAGSGKNNSLMQAVHDVGPIPIGLYTMQSPIDSYVHGPYAIPLLPDVTNEMFNRDHFLCHGDSIVAPGTASEGCVIQPKASRIRMWESGDHRLLVVESFNV